MPFTITDCRPKPFFEVDTEFVDKYATLISSDAFKMLIVLVRLEEDPPETLDLEKLLNLQPRQILAATAELVRAGLLLIDRSGKVPMYGVTTRGERGEVGHA